jgi:hypothetical protein
VKESIYVRFYEIECSKKFLGEILDFCLPPALPLVFENCIFSSSRKSENMKTEADFKDIGE